MKVLIPLVLAIAQFLALSFATPLGAPRVADARGFEGVVQQIPVPTTLAQVQTDDSSQTTTLPSPFGDSSLASSVSSVSSSGSTMRVQIDMFSGRPNPSWDISSQEADQVRATFRQLPERTAGSRPDRLGYRGVIVNGDGVRDLGLTRLLVGGGIVIAEGFQGVRYYSDADRGLERQIFQTGRTRLDPTDYAAFKSIAFP